MQLSSHTHTKGSHNMYRERVPLTFSTRNIMHERSLCFSEIDFSPVILFSAWVPKERTRIHAEENSVIEPTQHSHLGTTMQSIAGMFEPNITLLL